MSGNDDRSYDDGYRQIAIDGRESWVLREALLWATAAIARNAPQGVTVGSTLADRDDMVRFLRRLYPDHSELMSKARYVAASTGWPCLLTTRDEDEDIAARM